MLLDGRGNCNPSWQSTASKLFESKGKSSALPSIHSMMADFCRAMVSIAVLRSMPTNLPTCPRRSASLATMPVPQAMSSRLSSSLKPMRSSRSLAHMEVMAGTR